MKNIIKAILFDAGYTLNYPASGHWFIPPNHVDFFKGEIGTRYSEAEIEKAFKRADGFLEAHHFVECEDEEFDQFKTFYETFFQSLQYPHVTDTLLSELSHDVVYNDDKFKFYDDVFTFVPRFETDYRLGIISDTWPSLERVFVSTRLRSYFSTFIISSRLGIWKPHPGMYHAALNELKIAPHEAIFIDDSIKNCRGAGDVGIHPVLIDRNETSETTDQFPRIKNLEELGTMLYS